MDRDAYYAAIAGLTANVNADWVTQEVAEKIERAAFNIAIAVDKRMKGRAIEEEKE